MPLIAGPRRALLTPRALRGEKYVRSLSPAVWFRKGQGITSAAGVASDWADQSGNGRNATGSVIDLPFTGTKYLYLPGVAGNYASTPDSVANSITGDIDIRVRVALDDWTPAAVNILTGKAAAIGQYSFNFYVNAAGTLSLTFTVDGTTQNSGTSTVATGISDGAASWVRVTRAASSGKVNFYTAADSSIEPSSWTLLGAADVPTTAGNIFDSTSAVEVGTQLVGSSAPAKGKIYRVIIKSGIAGTTVVDFNAADGTDGASSFVSSTTGETWTINKSGALPAYLVGTSWLMSNGTSHTMATAAFVLDQPCTLFALAKDLTWTLNDYICDGAAKDSGALIQSATTPRFKVSAGSAIGENAGLAVGTLGIRCAVINGADSLTQVNLGTPVTGDAGAAQMDGVTLFSSGAVATGFWNGMMQEFAAFPGAFTATQIAGVAAYLASVGSVELDS